MKIGIIGVGVVGNAIKNFYENINKYKLSYFDKYKNIGSIEDVKHSDIIFICLPTPFKDNKYDITEIESVCNILKMNNVKSDIIIKSTILPGTTNDLIKKYNLNIIHNPEFLSQKTALKDFENQSHIIIGSNNKETLNRIKTFYESDFSKAEFTLTIPEETELIKLSLNNFYCVKIQYFTEIYLLCEKLNLNYENIKTSMLKNNWINPMHTNVPGTDGKISYGGMCLPKDSMALFNFMKNNIDNYKILEATITERNILRNN
jgi:UDPglucose 6-dehydrogenase